MSFSTPISCFSRDYFHEGFKWILRTRKWIFGPESRQSKPNSSLPLWVSQRGAVSPLLPTLNNAPRPYIGNPALASPEEVPCLARYSPDWPRRWSMPSRLGLVPEPLPRLWPHPAVPDEPMESTFQTLSDSDWGRDGCCAVCDGPMGGESPA